MLTDYPTTYREPEPPPTLPQILERAMDIVSASLAIGSIGALAGWVLELWWE